MSGEYIDSKGIRHNFEFQRDEANQNYLKEERIAREMQSAQLSLTLQQKAEQEAHNKKIEEIAKREAAAKESQREFEKTILWLEKSDANGRFEYIAEKVNHLFQKMLLDQALDRVIDLAFNHFAVQNKEWNVKKESFKLLLNNINSSQQVLERNKSEFQKSLDAITLANNKKGNFPFWIRLLVTIPVILLAGIVIIVFLTSGIEAPTVYIARRILAGFLILSLGVYLVIGKNKDKKRVKSAQEIIDKEKPNNDRLIKAIENSTILHRQNIEVARDLKSAMLRDCETFVSCSIVEIEKKSNTVNNVLIDCINQWQLSVPSSIRINCDKISADVMVKYAKTGVEKLQREAVSKVTSVEFISKQFNDIDHVSEIIGWIQGSGSQGSGSLFDVWLTFAPSDKKISTIKAVREVKTGIGLAEALTLVDGAPKMLLEGCMKADAEAAVRKIEEAGGKAEIR